MRNLVLSELDSAKEEQDLTVEEKSILQRLRIKKLSFLLGAYLPLSYIFIDAWTRVYPGSYLEAVKALFQFRLYHTWYLLLLFIILTIYFTKYFFGSVYPLFKDLKTGKKWIFFFTPGKYQTPFFAEYYVKTILKDRPLIRIDKGLYDAIEDHTTACIHIAPNSEFVFSIQIGERKMKFKYSTLVDDI